MDVVNTFIAPDEIRENAVLPKYYQIYAQLKKEIVFGAYRPGARFLSLRDLKAKYGVDLQTARAAIGLLEKDGFLRNRPMSGVYVNKADARAPGISVGNIWFFQPGPEKNHPYFNGILTALQRRAGAKGLKVIVNRDSEPAGFPYWFQPETGDGLVVTGKIDADFVLSLRRYPRLRYVVVGNYDLPEETPNIHTRVKEAVYRAMETIARAGRRKVAVIAGKASIRATKDMMDGVAAAARNGLVDYVGGVFESPEDGYAAMTQLGTASIDSVLVAEPAFLGLCRYVFERKIKYPEKLFVVRYGKNEEYGACEGVAAAVMSNDKDAFAENILDVLFYGGPRRVEVDIDVNAMTPGR